MTATKTIIREVYYGTGTTICIIRSNCYGSQYNYIKQLVAEACRDFPDLDDDDFQIVQFGGQRYARTFGIQFTTSELPPESYEVISRLEQLL